ncbi:MAG: hypothetical protein ABIJ52_12330 [Pseudomonadota bacterium]
MKLPDEVRLVIKAVVFGMSAEDETTENRILRAIEHYGSHSHSSGITRFCVASSGRPMVLMTPGSLSVKMPTGLPL